MKSMDDLFKELYEDDPEGYAEHLKRMEEMDIEFEIADKKNREKTAELFLSETRDDIQSHIETLTEEELLKHYSYVHRMQDSLERQYHKLMNENVFSKSKTTLKDIVNKYNWEDIKNTILRLFLEQEKNINGYEYVFSELKKLNLEENKENNVIILRHNKEDGGDYYDICAVKPKDLSSYAIEFCRWEEWLGFFANQKDLELHGEKEFIAHCMWEMTFDGFTQEQIQESAEDLKQRVEEAEKEIEEYKKKNEE